MSMQYALIMLSGFVVMVFASCIENLRPILLFSSFRLHYVHVLKTSARYSIYIHIMVICC